MRKIFLSGAVICAVLFSSLICEAQKKEPVIATYRNKTIPKAEFEYIYQKNNGGVENSKTHTLQQHKDYLDLYVNFKLKVQEAQDMGMDTSVAFKDELMNYRQQLAQPYLLDKEVMEDLLREAYERMKTEVNASHILVLLKTNASPADTLAAFKKISTLRDSVLQGKDFGYIAQHYSEDKSAKKNNGLLGYFGVLAMVYSFESMAYKTSAGQVSPIFRTQYGYHILKVNSVRPTLGSRTHVAHILIKSMAKNSSSGPDTSDAAKKIQEIYSQLKAGEDFAKLAAQYSDDKKTGKTGGELPWFTSGQMIPEFDEACYALKNPNDFSELVKTAYGWHIIKLLGREPIPSYEDARADLKNRISKDSRAETGKEKLITQLKQTHNYTMNNANYEKFVSQTDSSILKGNYKNKLGNDARMMPLFTLDKQNYTAGDFASSIETARKVYNNTPIASAVQRLYKEFTDDKILEYEENLLEGKYPEFKYLMKEYRDGILLFQLTDEKVWQKANNDSVGLRAFWGQNKSKYQWGKRMEAGVFSSSDSTLLTKVRMMAEQKMPVDSIKKKVNRGSALNLNYEDGTWEKGGNPAVDKMFDSVTEGLTPVFKNDASYYFLAITKILPPGERSYEDARAACTSDYQEYLEKKWVEALRQKYPVKINMGTLKKLFKS